MASLVTNEEASSYDFALSSFVVCLLVLKILDIKRFLSLHLVICPSDSLSIYLEHCPLPQSLATTWKQDFKPNLSVFWNTSTSLCDHSIYRLLSTLWYWPWTLSTYQEKSKKSLPPWTALPQYLESLLPFLVTTILDVFKPVYWSEQRHICTESLRFKVNCDYTLHLGQDRSNNRS